VEYRIPQGLSALGSKQNRRLFEGVDFSKLMESAANFNPAHEKDPMQGYNIKVVANRTGLSQHVIRVWERRYGAVTPRRTETNRRIYSERDIEKLKLLQQATAAGHQIGRIAQHSVDELQRIVAQDVGTANTGELSHADQIRIPPVAPATHLETCLQAVEGFDTPALEKALMHASVVLSLPDLLEKVVGPLMEKVGEFWQEGSLRVAHEHAVSSVVRTFLGNLRFSKPATEYAPAAIVATPAGQLHAIGALMAAVTAAAEGWQVIYLGPNLPAQEIALAATSKNAKAILLSIVYPQDDPFLGDELGRLRTMLPDQSAILAGGRAARAYTVALQTSQAIILDDLKSLRRQLAKLRGASVLS